MKSVGTQSSYYNSGEAAQKLGKNKKQGCFLCVNMGWCVWIWRRTESKGEEEGNENRYLPSS